MDFLAKPGHSEPSLHASSLAGQGRSLLGFIIPTAGTGDLFRVREREGKGRGGDAESVGGRVHVAAVAQLVGEERKRLEQIRPKACCPTCHAFTHTDTHTHTQNTLRFAYPEQCWECGTVFSVREACGSLLPRIASAIISTRSVNISQISCS